MTTTRTIALMTGLLLLAMLVIGASFFAGYYRNRISQTITPTPTAAPVSAPANPCLTSDGVQQGVFTSFESALARPLEVCGFVIAGEGVLYLPPQITELQNVKVINMLDNALTEIPPYIGALRELKILILSGNSISTLPNELSQLPNLEVVHLLNNPVSQEEQDRLRRQMPNVQFFF